MKVVCLGGGPAGLYFAISMKLRNPSHEVLVVERHRAGETFGWGVVFSDQTLENLRTNDPVSADTIAAGFAHWDDIAVSVGDSTQISSGHGFIGIGRRHLLQILQARAGELGIELRFETEFDADLSAWASYDLIVAADGVNSRVRTTYADRFDVDIDQRANRFVWLGTRRLFDAFAFLFEETPAGWIWAHAYRFDETHSTFIVECSEATWRKLGFADMDADQVCRTCETIFSRHLGGEALLSNAAHLRGSAAWIHFRRILCSQWSFGNVVLLGDAAHTAHFSIGSGTKLALEDAIQLATTLNRQHDAPERSLSEALAEYQAVRQTEVLRIQNSARNSTEWFEALDRYIGFAPIQFAYSLLTRSQRVSHENLRLRDSAWLSAVERWFAGSDEGSAPPPPMFTPFTVRGLTVANRIVVSPVLTYAAEGDGKVTDFHLAHYGARVLGGAGLVMTEMVAVSPEGRATIACPGLWEDAQIDGWRRIVELSHANGSARIGIQLGHAGARAGSPLPGSDEVPPLWKRLSASTLPWGPSGPSPSAMSRADMDTVRDAFVATARRAAAAGFDLIELQCGHGFLLSSFITPALNDRTDEYGGLLENRMRFPLEVVRAVREVWGDRPLAARISANDWIGEAGITPQAAVEIARRLSQADVDIVDVSSGETAADGRPVYGRMYQTPFSDRIRNEAPVPTIAVGNIYETDHVNSIIAAGRADLVALGRPHLADPAWTLHAAATLGYRGVEVPAPYRLGQEQLLRNSAATATPADIH